MSATRHSIVGNGKNLLNTLEDDDSQEGLLMSGQRRVDDKRDYLLDEESTTRRDWIRPYWLGAGLSLVLFAFWLLDSLKDPVFAVLVDGNLDKHQPPAKLCSVATTLLLVGFLEFVSHSQIKHSEEKHSSDAAVLEGGGTWQRMTLDVPPPPPPQSDRISARTFVNIGASYIVAFGVMAVLIQRYPTDGTDNTLAWRVLAYAEYSLIESFGSLAVAAFWSYTNSSLSLHEAECFYGIIISIAQLGAVGGSTMVTTNLWRASALILVACLVIVLHILVMTTYDKRFPPTQPPQQQEEEPTIPGSCWSGVYLILHHHYVLLILGVSCLSEVSLTCLDYQMKLLGLKRFEETQHDEGMNFVEFMGHYGQMVNFTSFLLSYFCFSRLILKLGLRWTLRIFPTLLLIATVVAYGAIPGNLTVLFFSMSLLKAMTYSIHDPSKEILYLPTSNPIKFRAKFWIDVVGARVAKAVGSSINTVAGSVDRSVRVGSIPSLTTAALLWLACYRVGIEFDRLVRTGRTVGVDANERRYEEGDYSMVEFLSDDLAPSDEASAAMEQTAASFSVKMKLTT